MGDGDVTGRGGDAGYSDEGLLRALAGVRAARESAEAGCDGREAEEYAEREEEIAAEARARGLRP